MKMTQKVLQVFEDDKDVVFAAALKAPFGIAVWQGLSRTGELTLRFINQLGAGATGKPAESLFNLPMQQALPEVAGTPLETTIREVLQNGGEGQVLVRTAQPGQEVRTFRNKVTRISNNLVLATFDEVTEQVILEREYKVERRTSLATRAYFDDVFEELVEDHAVNDGSVGLLFIDLDKFKWINDTYGHICGDEILTEVARRLRLINPQPKLIARWGGDEFAILTRGSAAENRELAEKIISALSTPVIWGKERIKVNISIGIVTSNGEGKLNPRKFMMAVDRAMYEAKQAGGNLWREVSMDFQSPAAR
jgi:diguanylate cyclase (GGDEF)-like protein